jgi:transcriptional regulator with XRE-family HTH domain
MAERKALIKERELRGWTRPVLAKKMRASRHYIHSVEVGLRNPSLAMMHRWVKALGGGASLDLFRTTAAKRAA